MAGQADRTLGPAHEVQGSPWAQQVSSQGLLLPGQAGGCKPSDLESLGLPQRVSHRRTDLH